MEPNFHFVTLKEARFVVETNSRPERVLFSNFVNLSS